MLNTVPPWLKTATISAVTAVCAAGVVSAICITLFTSRIQQCNGGSCLGDADVHVDDLGLADDAGGESSVDHLYRGDPLVDPLPSPSLLSSYSTAAVAVDSVPCSAVGRKVLEMEGTAVDAAVAVLFCNGVVTSQSMGIGGGFLMTISLSNGTRLSLVAREMAPQAVDVNMFKNRSSRVGPLSAGVPGEVLGLWEAKQRLGNPMVSWKSLLEPSIRLCEQGITVSPHAAKSLRSKSKLIKADPGLRSVFVNPETEEVWKEGDVYKHPKFARTLKIIAEQGGPAFYSGQLAEDLADDISKGGGIITLQDLNNYRVSWEEPVTVKIPGVPYTILSSPPPGSGAIMSTILGVTGLLKPDPLDKRSPLLWHRFVEACKFAYGKRTLLGDWADPNIRDEVKKLVANLTSSETLLDIASKISDTKTFNSTEHYGGEYYNTEDAGTAHISIISPAGDAVSVTCTINLLYGSKFMSPKTGIILNNQMDDFSYPGITNYFGLQPSPTNFPAPGKRPLSSMSPSIVLDDSGRVLVVAGASGGTKIITAVAQVLLRVLYLGEDIKTAIDSRRLHHQLLPMKVRYEVGTTKWIIKGLQKFGHVLEPIGIGGASVQGISVDRRNGQLSANADFRKGGTTDGF